MFPLLKKKTDINFIAIGIEQQTYLLAAVAKTLEILYIDNQSIV